MLRLPPPRPTDPIEEHADWIEWYAITSAARDYFVPWNEYSHAIQMGGVDAIDLMDVYDGSVEPLLNDLIDELRARQIACGDDTGAYPFRSSTTGLAYDATTHTGVYRFLLLLTLFGLTAGPDGTRGDRIFERVSTHALKAYFGGECSGLDAQRFGFPRENMSGSFRDAVDELCTAMGEGVCYRESSIGSVAKDAKLDLVAYRRFPDQQQGQLIAFGQCATGKQWKSKLTELQPRSWCHLWLQRAPLVEPIRTFFVPHRVERTEWERAVLNGGIMFERCRIAWLLTTMPSSLAAEVSAWSDHVLSKVHVT